MAATERHHHRHHRRHRASAFISKRKKTLRAAGAALLLLLLLGLIYWGLSRLEQRLDTPPEGAGETVTRLEEPERPVVYYDGARYTEKDGLVTLLILGIDDLAPTEALGARNTSQADFAALAVFDPAEESCTTTQPSYQSATTPGSPSLSAFTRRIAFV